MRKCGSEAKERTGVGGGWVQSMWPVKRRRVEDEEKAVVGCGGAGVRRGCLIQSQCETVDICASRSPSTPTHTAPPSLCDWGCFALD